MDGLYTAGVIMLLAGGEKDKSTHERCMIEDSRELVMTGEHYEGYQINFWDTCRQERADYVHYISVKNESPIVGNATQTRIALGFFIYIIVLILLFRPKI